VVHLGLVATMFGLGIGLNDKYSAEIQLFNRYKINIYCLSINI
jgi:hypothetical protein